MNVFSAALIPKKSLLAEVFFSAVFGALLLGGLLLYLNLPHAAVYWAVFFLCLFLLPKAWLTQTAAPVLRDWWKMDRAQTRRLCLTAAASTLAFSLAAHGFLFANEFFSHDSLHHLIAQPAQPPYRRSLFSYYGCTIGRFLLPAYEGLRGYTTYAPWLIGVLFLVFMTLSAILLVRLLHIRSTAGAVLASGLLCTSASLSLTGATYIYCMDEYALSLLLAIAAVAFIQRRCFLLSLVCIATSLALYQAYFCTALVLSLFCVIQALTANERPAAVIRRGFTHLGVLFCGFCLYSLGWNLLCAIFHSEKTRLSETLFGGGFSSILRLLKESWLNYAQYLLDGRGTLGFLYPAVSCLIVLAVALWALGHLLNRDMPLPNKLLFALALCLLPIAFNLSYILFMGNTANKLTAFANGLIFPFLIFCWEHPPKQAPALHPRYRAAAALLLCVICWRNVIFANQAYLKKELEKTSTAALVTRIITRIEAVDGYIPNETPVILYPSRGNLSENPYLEYSRVRACFEDISSTDGSLTNSYATTPIGYLPSYINLYWNYPMVFGSFDDLTGAEQEQVEAMPLFPAAGSVELIGGNVIVHLV